MNADPREAHAAALLLCAVCFAIDATFAFIAMRWLGPFHVWFHAALAALALLLGALLLARRKRPSVRLSNGIFITLAVPQLVHVWLAAEDMIRLGIHVDPLMPSKLLTIAMALLAPASLALGAVLVLVSSAEAVLCWQLLEPSAPRAWLAAEPWPSFVAGGIALALLASRARWRVLAGRVGRIGARADALAGLARLFAAARERVSAPLETLESGVAVLAQRLPEELRIVEPMRKATARLRDLWTTLAVADDWASSGRRVAVVDLERAVDWLTVRHDAPIAKELGILPGRTEAREHFGYAVAADPTEAHSRALMACLVTLGFAVAEAGIAWKTVGLWPIGAFGFAHAGIAAALGIWLASRARRPSAQVSDLVFVLLVLPFFPTTWATAHAAARLGLWMDPFWASDLKLLGFPLLLPASLRLGAVLLLFTGVVRITLWRSLIDAGYSGYFGEPWLTLLFLGISSGLLVSRWRARILAARLVEERAREDALALSARLVSAVSDRANTPLQTLEVGMTLLSPRCPEVLTDMRDAASRVRDVWATFAVAEAWAEPYRSATTPDLERELTELARAAGAARGSSASAASQGRGSPP